MVVCRQSTPSSALEEQLALEAHSNLKLRRKSSKRSITQN